MRGERYIAWAEGNSRRIMWMTILAAFVLGVGCSLYIGPDLKFGDEPVYYKAAMNLRHHGIYSLDGVHPTISRPPVYAWFLSFLMLGSEKVILLRITSVLLFCLCIYLSFLIVSGYTSAAWGALCGIMLLCYPALLFSAATLYPQTLATALLLSCVALLTANRSGSPRIWLAAGIIYGFLVLTIPTFMAILIPFSLWAYYSFGKHMKHITLVWVGVALCLSPWIARNYAHYGSFVFVSANSGHMLILGNSENTTPNQGPGVDISRYKKRTEAEMMNEAERDAFFRRTALNYILEHKARSLKLYFLKFLNHFNYRNNLASITQSTRMWDAIMLITYGPLLMVFLLRLLILPWIKCGRYEWFIIALYLVSGFLYAVFFTRIRYRLPFDVLLVQLISIFIYRLYEGRYAAGSVRGTAGQG